jgi:hypothetical protein
MKRTLVLAALVIGAAPAAAEPPAGCPVGVWERVGKDGQRLTLTIAPDHLRLKGADEKGETLLLLEGDHRVTKDSILFGIVTSVESHGAGVFGESGKAIWALPVDTLFSWRFRVDGDVLTVKEARPETPSFDLCGRFTRKPCCKGKCAARPKLLTAPRKLPGELVKLRVGGLSLVGPEINRDEAAGKLWVNGTGALRLDTGAVLNAGGQDVPLTVQWNKGLHSSGQNVDVRGCVHAEQGRANLSCEQCEFRLENPLAPHGALNSEEPHVRALVARGAHLRERFEAEGRLQKYQSIRAANLALDLGGKGRRLRAAGPGKVCLFQRGAGAETSRCPSRGTLTCVTFHKRLDAQDDTMLFAYDAQVLILPGVEPDAIHRLEECGKDCKHAGALSIRCDKLRMQCPGEEQPGQMLQAAGKVEVKSDKIHARADRAAYDQESGRLILEGNEVCGTLRLADGHSESFRGNRVVCHVSLGVLEVSHNEPQQAH